MPVHNSRLFNALLGPSKAVYRPGVNSGQAQPIGTHNPQEPLEAALLGQSAASGPSQPQVDPLREAMLGAGNQAAEQGNAAADPQGHLGSGYTSWRDNQVSQTGIVPGSGVNAGRFAPRDPLKEAMTGPAREPLYAMSGQRSDKPVYHEDPSVANQQEMRGRRNTQMQLTGRDPRTGELLDPGGGLTPQQEKFADYQGRLDSRLTRSEALAMRRENRKTLGDHMKDAVARAAEGGKGDDPLLRAMFLDQPIPGYAKAFLEQQGIKSEADLRRELADKESEVAKTDMLGKLFAGIGSGEVNPQAIGPFVKQVIGGSQPGGFGGGSVMDEVTKAADNAAAWNRVNPDDVGGSVQSVMLTPGVVDSPQEAANQFANRGVTPQMLRDYLEEVGAGIPGTHGFANDDARHAHWQYKMLGRKIPDKFKARVAERDFIRRMLGLPEGPKLPQ